MYVFIMAKKRRGSGTEVREVKTDKPLPEIQGLTAKQSSALDRLYGLMREDFAACGGGEAFLKRLRTDPDPKKR
ncbi:MAG: hypothetical protein WCC27_10420 [Acidobacteriaceae bacterium]